MQLICSNQHAISKFVRKNSLLDGKILKIEIFSVESSVTINVEFQMRPSSEFQNILISCKGCKEFNFSYSDDYCFYNVESIKFFQTPEELIYISFDPYDESEAISENDQDIISAKEIHFYEN